MINQPKVVEVFEESIVDDDIIVIIDDRHYDIDDCDSNIDDEWIECMDCVQRKMICIISILIIGTILLLVIIGLKQMGQVILKLAKI